VVCPGCGTAIPAGAAFCPGCGIALSSRLCSQCGAELAEAARFCHACGHPVPEPALPAASMPATPAAATPVPTAPAAVPMADGGPAVPISDECPNCGHPEPIPEGSQCPLCGWPTAGSDLPALAIPSPTRTSAPAGPAAPGPTAGTVGGVSVTPRRVTEPGANLLDSPGGANRLGHLPPGTQVMESGRQGEWVRVTALGFRGEVTGWVRESELLRARAAPNAAERAAVGTAGTKQCPFCGQEIKGEALVCRYCRRTLDPGVAAPRPGPPPSAPTPAAPVGPVPRGQTMGSQAILRRAQARLEPGEFAQIAFPAQTVSQYWQLTLVFPWYLVNRYRCAVVTDRRILLFDSGRWTQRSPKSLIRALPRATRLGPWLGVFWYRTGALGETLRISFKYRPHVEAADAAIYMTP
jgi:hypothetical protein